MMPTFQQQTSNSMIYNERYNIKNVGTDNKENMNQNFSFLNRKINKGVCDEEEMKGRESDCKNMLNSSKKHYLTERIGCPLKEINFNGNKIYSKKNTEDDCCSILQMSIKEKNMLDVEEKEKKRNNKIRMIKLHQKNKYAQSIYQNNHMMLDY